MRIFDKDCPLCGKHLPRSATYCECGFSFNPEEMDDTTQTLVMAAQEEELFENYLAARVAQTEEALTVGLAILAKNPGDGEKEREVARLSEEAKQAQSELATQNQKAVHARQAARTARNTLHKLKTAYTLEQQTRTTQEQQQIDQAKRRKLHQQKVAQAKALAANADKDIQAAKAARAAHSTRAQQAQNKTVHPAPAMAASKTRSPAPATTPKQAAPAVSQQPTTAFRAKQAANAESAMCALRAAKAAMQLAQAKNESTQQATTAFRAKQAAKAAAAQHKTQQQAQQAQPRKKQRPTNRIECPHCTALLPLTAQKCGCGYVLQKGAGNKESALVLNAEDRAAMKKFSRGNGNTRLTKSE